MRIFTADQAKRNFGAMLKAADDGFVRIDRHGRPAYILMPARIFDAYEKIRRAQTEERILVTTESALAKYGAGDGDSALEIVRESNRLMKRLLDGEKRGL